MDTRLLPGAPFPSITLPMVGGGEASLQAAGNAKLIVVYRGQFCPFCQGTLLEINSKLDSLKEANVEIVAVSADPVEVSTSFVAAKGLRFPVACGLTVEQIRALGLYLSDPKDYQPQKHSFSEPGYFFLTADNIIKYVCVSSHPMGGRVNVDALLAGVKWSEQELKTNPAFVNVMWGSK